MESAHKIIVAVCIMIIQSISMTAREYNVRDFGAVGDGRALDSKAINKAIDVCVADGGGKVEIPAGTFLCGSIRLKSNIELHLEAGAKILAAPAGMNVYDESEKFEGK